MPRIRLPKFKGKKGGGKAVGKAASVVTKKAARASGKKAAASVKTDNLKVNKPTFSQAKKNLALKNEEAKAKANAKVQLIGKRAEIKADALAKNAVRKETVANQRAALRQKNAEARAELRQKNAEARNVRRNEFKDREMRSRANARAQWRQNLENERHKRALGREMRRNIRAQTKSKVSVERAKADNRRQASIKGAGDKSFSTPSGGTTIINGDKGGGFRDAMLIGAMMNNGGHSAAAEPAQPSDGGNGQGGININIDNADNAGTQKETSWSTSPQNSSGQSSNTQGSGGMILPGTNSGTSSTVINKPGVSGTGNISSIKLA